MTQQITKNKSLFILLCVGIVMIISSCSKTELQQSNSTKIVPTSNTNIESKSILPTYNSYTLPNIQTVYMFSGLNIHEHQPVNDWYPRNFINGGYIYSSICIKCAKNIWSDTGRYGEWY